jgi:hypothetical protein
MQVFSHHLFKLSKQPQKFGRADMCKESCLTTLLRVYPFQELRKSVQNLKTYIQLLSKVIERDSIALHPVFCSVKLS